jgi:hypothetical protein
MQLPRSLICLVLCVLLGCGNSEPATVPVNGIVTLKDKPLEGAVVRFFPQGNTPGHGGEAITDAGGKFAITAAQTKSKGLPIGTYRIVITCLRRADGTVPASGVPEIDSDARELVPEPYSSRRDTPLSATVDAGGKTHDFHLPLKK